MNAPPAIGLDQAVLSGDVMSELHANVVVPQRPPIVLIVDDQEWTLRSLETFLAPNGFAVMRAFTGAKGYERAVAHTPDIVVIDADLPDMTGAQLCQRLREDPRCGRGLPILISSSERLSKRQRLEAFATGAWDVVKVPLDAEELVLRLKSYADARYEAERIREDGLLDQSTGLYNPRGLERRAQEMKSWAYRERDALGCIVFAPVNPLDDDAPDQDAEVQHTAEIVKNTARISDVAGRIGKNQFAIFAPSTSAEGIVRLAHRLVQAIKDDAHVAHDQPVIRAGYDAIPDVRSAPGETSELLARASKAFRKTTTTGSGWLQPFPDL